MESYSWSAGVARKQHAARFEVRRGALSAGRDLYRAKMPLVAANTFCGNNDDCVGFTWSQEELKGSEPTPFMPGQNPLIYFKSAKADGAASVNDDALWTSYIKVANSTAPKSSAGSIRHGPEGCQVAGHLSVRKVRAPCIFHYSNVHARLRNRSVSEIALFQKSLFYSSIPPSHCT